MAPTPVHGAACSEPDLNRARQMPPHGRSKKSATAETKVVTPRRLQCRNELVGEEHQEDEKREGESRPSDAVTKQPEQQENTRQEVADQTDEKQPVACKDATELPPAQDTQLRRNYLQRMSDKMLFDRYRQLQGTHPSHDDARIRHLATTIEMEMSQKAPTRRQYIAAMEQELHKLMELELEHTNSMASLHVPSDRHCGFVPPELAPSRTFEYAQALAKAQAQERSSPFAPSSPFSTPQATSSDTSFQSLMSHELSHLGTHESIASPQLPSVPLASAAYPPLTFSSTTNDMPSPLTPRHVMEPRHPVPLHPPIAHHRIHARVTNFHDFAAQIQHLDKSVLLELLWNQRSALARWQNQAKHLELQLANLQAASVHRESPRLHPVLTSPTVRPHVAAEAERQRARERHTTRLAQQTSRPLDAYGPQGDPFGGSDNAQLYWDRVRALKAAYHDKLRTALRALAHTTVPPHSVYSVKAQSMMQNISLVLTILNEEPSTSPPRKFQVLDSIERFMQVSVTPIVHKVLSSTGSHTPTASSASPVPQNVPSRPVDAALGLEKHGNVETKAPQRAEKAQAAWYQTDDRDVEAKPTESSILTTPAQVMDELTCTSLETDTEVVSSGFGAIKVEQARDGAATTETRRASLSSDDTTREWSRNKVMEANVDEALNEFSELADINFEDPVDANVLAKENQSVNLANRAL